MTWKPEQIVVSDAEVRDFCTALGMLAPGIETEYHRNFLRALAAFLAARMPKKRVLPDDDGWCWRECMGHNAALNAVARGRG
jgi:hypothetical protein